MSRWWAASWIATGLASCALAAVAAGQSQSGHPPMGALERHDPRLYRVGFEVELDYEPPPARSPLDVRTSQFALRNVEFSFPMILSGTFSRADPETMRAAMWLDNVADPAVNERGRLAEGQPFGMSLAVLPLPEFAGENLRWRFEFDVEVWSSRIDDAKAGTVAWPRNWPADVQHGLRPQRFIESDDQIFRKTVERISEGQLRLVPPYLAAKDIVRYVLQNVQVTGNRTHRREMGIIEGLNVSGAKATAERGMGSAHDLVCVCVAMLRAAGIPSRPVVGFMRVPPRNRFELVSWAEFYLPDTGWVPFDPAEMQGKGLHRHVREPWPEFGTMRALNERIPLAFAFTPAGGHMGPGRPDMPAFPSIWGWNITGAGEQDQLQHIRQQIRVSMETKGRASPEQR